MAAKKVVPLTTKDKPQAPQTEPLTQEKEGRESIQVLISELERTLDHINDLLFVADNFSYAEHKDDEWDMAMSTLIAHIKEVAEKGQRGGGVGQLCLLFPP